MARTLPKSEEYNEKKKQRMHGIGTRIGIAREKKGLTQGELGAIIEEDQQTIQKWEAGDARRNISATALACLAEALQVSTDWLLFGKGSMSQDMTMRDCAKILFHDLPAHFDCSWSINAPVALFGEITGAYPIKTLPTLTYQLTLPNESLNNIETGYPTGYVRVKDEYQPFIACASNVQHLEAARKHYPQFFHEDDYIDLFATIPNTPLHH